MDQGIDQVLTWTVIQFIDDATVEAVPSTWIQGDFCHWPSFAKSKLLSAIRKCEPLNTCWPSHKVKIFRNGTFDDYMVARSKAKVAEDTSDLNSACENNGYKRKRIQKILSSSDDSSLNESQLSSPPKIKKFKQQAKGKDKRNIEPHQKPIEMDTMQSYDSNIFEESFTQPNNSSAEKDKQFKTLMEQIHIIRGMTIDILSEVKSLKKEIRKSHIPEINNSFYKKHRNIKFPLTTQEELESLESILQNEDDSQLLVAELAKIGGTNCYNFVKRVLSSCLTNDMALKYSWLGRKGKRIFSKLNMAKVIIYAAEKAGITQSRSDTETAIQTWLKRASDRNNSAINKNN